MAAGNKTSVFVQHPASSTTGSVVISIKPGRGAPAHTSVGWNVITEIVGRGKLQRVGPMRTRDSGPNTVPSTMMWNLSRELALMSTMPDDTVARSATAAASRDAKSRPRSFLANAVCMPQRALSVYLCGTR